jgi:undecaprenyl diphosphate synthase
LSKLDSNKIPKHIAVIMDGNGRWAKKLGADRILGHRSAINAVKDTVEGCAELGVKFLTLYAFSTENWSRPQSEVNALMELLVSTIRKETATLIKNNIKLASIGDIKSLPVNCQKELEEAKKITENNIGMTLTLALSYSSRWEIIDAVKKIAFDVKNDDLKPEEITDKVFESYLNASFMPDPELLIRTSGESRISNFLLWQIAYTEIHITPVLWPDFRKKDLHAAIEDYQKRERRFGKTSEQLS